MSQIYYAKRKYAQKSGARAALIFLGIFCHLGNDKKGKFNIYKAIKKSQKVIKFVINI